MYSGVAVILPDGGKPTEQFLSAGFLDAGFSISKDGRSIEGPGDYMVDTDTQLGKFIVSLVEGEGLRLPEELLGNLRNYDGIAGTRATFVRVVDEALTEKLGKKTSKKGKEFPREDLLVSEVLSLPDAKAAKGAAAKKTTAPKPAAAKAAPAAAPATPAAEAPAADAGNTDEVVKAILTENKGTLEFAKLGAAAVRYGLNNKMDKNEYGALRETVISDEYLAGAVDRGVIAIAGEGKDRVLIAA